MSSTTTASPRFLFRDLEEDDVQLINRLFLEEYGNYPYLLSKGIVGSGICLAAVDAITNQVVGFERGMPYKTYPGVFDLCSLIVDEAYRNRGVATLLTRACIDRLLAQGCRILVSEPVANRPDCASQSTYLHFDFLMMAIQPCMHPGIKIEVLRQPESLLIAASAVDNRANLGRRKIYLPSRYKEIPRLLFPRQIRNRTWSEKVAGEIPKPVLHEGYQVGEAIGSEFLDVAVNWPEAIDAIERAVLEGFRFAGFLPGFGQTAEGGTYDILRMYRSQQVVNFEVVHVVPFMKPLRNFLAQDQRA